MTRILALALTLLPSFAFADGAQSYLPEPTIAAANVRDSAECAALGCQPGTTEWWSIILLAKPQNGNAALIVIAPSGDYGPSPSTNAGSAPLSTSEMSSLLTSAQVSPALAAQTPNQNASVGQPWNFTLPPGTFIDPRGETMTYEIWQGPDWLALSLDGVFSGTPTAAGSWQITVTATDQSGFSTTETFTLTAQ